MRSPTTLTVDLFVTLYDGVDTVQPIADADVVRAAEQCLKFLGKSADGKLVAAIDPSDDAYEFSLTIKDCYEDLEQIRVYILTDRRAKRASSSPGCRRKSVRLEVMDIERLHRHWSEGKPRDELVVSFEEVCGSPYPVSMSRAKTRNTTTRSLQFRGRRCGCCMSATEQGCSKPTYDHSSVRPARSTRVSGIRCVMHPNVSWPTITVLY